MLIYFKDPQPQGVETRVTEFGFQLNTLYFKGDTVPHVLTRLLLISRHEVIQRFCGMIMFTIITASSTRFILVLVSLIVF